MAHLAKLHAITGIVNKEIPYRAAMGAVAGDTAHLPATPLFRRVRLTLERMAFTALNPHNVHLGANMAMT